MTRPPSHVRSITRRCFITTMGAGVAGVAASGAFLPSAAKAQSPTVQKAGELRRITLKVNEHPYVLLAESRWTLLYVLREVLGLTAAKEGCGRGECGACTVLIDDIPRYACMTLAVEAEGHAVVTPEGLMEGEELGPVQQAFAQNDAFQCGYCTSGQIMAAEGLLRARPDPSPEEIRRGVSGNLCRCGAYTHIFEAVEAAARMKKK